MSRQGRKVRFQERELARAIRAIDKAGQEVRAVHIDNNGEVTLNIVKRPEDESTTQLVA